MYRLDEELLQKFLIASSSYKNKWGKATAQYFLYILACVSFAQCCFIFWQEHMSVAHMQTYE